MRVADLVAAAACAALGAYLVREGVELGLGRPVNPGSGFIFWWIGIMLIGCGAVLALIGLVAPPAEPVPAGEGHWRLALGAAAAMVVYALAFEPIGFIPSTILLLTGLFLVVGRQAWPAALGLGAAGALLSWFVFARLLSSPLPPGLLAGTVFGS
ncbi:MAG: tripartite tricarboxylate transporter TctB family protein [Rhizobiales bacterium]|nr:tripartite tricarboxylate transporter TctB family protein [Hyphomicrobiales bacterium]